tara:strand:- start:1611 stop:2903 length:1293 start_codon:yes stop_codon:yes gene_type:complete
MILNKTVSTLILTVFVFLGCSKSEDPSITGKTPTPTETFGQVKLQITGYSSFGSTPFSLNVLDANGALVKSLEDLSAIPEKIELEDGEYTAILESIRPQIITADVNLFKGVSDKFVINGESEISINMTVEREAFKGWVEVPNVPLEARTGSVSFTINGTIYVGMGYNSTHERLNDWWSYSIEANEWAKLDDFPGEGRTFVTTFSIGSKGYICMGYTENSENSHIESKELWEFDAQTNVWSQKSDFTGIFRDSPVALVVDDKAYMGTGINNGITTLSDFYQYDSTVDEWSPVADVMDEATYGFGAMSLKGKGHLLGGTINSDVRTNQHLVYNPADNSWAELSPAPGDPRLEGVGFVINHIGYYGLGNIDNNLPASDLWRYDDEQDTWSRVSEFPGPARSTTVFGSNNDLGYYGFGTSTGEFNDFYLYYPEE